VIFNLWPCRPFYDLKSKIRSLIHYILRVLTLILIIIITHSLVRFDFSALLGFLAELSDAHLLKEEIFGIYGVSLEGRCYN
jgi:hypothetical protein